MTAVLAAEESAAISHRWNGLVCGVFRQLLIWIWQLEVGSTYNDGACGGGSGDSSDINRIINLLNIFHSLLLHFI